MLQTLLRHLKAFFLPAFMVFLLPLAIILLERANNDPFQIVSAFPQSFFGILLSAISLAFLFWTMRVCIHRGKGTIMPWDPPVQLIITGPYRHVRNPMILGVVMLQVGEAILFNSNGIAALAALFFVGNTIYFKYVEEPTLEKRFGEDYTRYRKNVPMWVPRCKPWEPQ
jgi:protein-S-isoprenylcysteine O-methyltransferase Ste14